MISMTRAIIAAALIVAPSAFAAAIEAREYTPINFDLKVWAVDGSMSVTPTHYHWLDRNDTTTTNADYTQAGTEPDKKWPGGSPDPYVIIGQMHFNEVPEDPNGRKIYITNKPGTAEEKAVEVCTILRSPNLLLKTETEWRALICLD